ncbi:hypothetical protein [Streptomyces poonensis]|uniref:Uncharacterized protein n=1 Tax=Streptomyces poonensis TaxID=68255 RepID=A0A918Q3I8_9ACTN|nr:hypothetical protein [Streptomyces poonensis]GGZ29467.1 hypothetical protein GCM10010365_57260 [Streptomyces poonensis]
MRRYIPPTRRKRRLTPLGPATALAVVLTGTVLLTGSGVAAADTNTGSQKSTMLCNVVLLSPGAGVGGCRNVQITSQNMTKRGTANTAVIDYANVKSATGLLP